MKVIVTGGRDYQDKEMVYRILDQLNASFVAVGDCPTGADLFAFEWCIERGVPYKLYEAKWTELGRKAGPIRNEEMIVDNLDAKFVVAFKGNKGTADTVRRAESANLLVLRVK